MTSGSDSRQEGTVAKGWGLSLGASSKRARRLLVSGAALLTFAPFLAMLPPGAASAGGRAISMVKVATTPQIPLGDTAVGSVPATSSQSGMVVLRSQDPSALTSFIAAVTDKNSPLFHHYLAPGSFAQRFGPSPSSIATVRSELSAEGLRVTNVSRDGLIVSFTGSAAKVEAAFRTGIERYRLANGAMGQATTSPMRMPSSIAGSVLAVVGLDNLVQDQAANIKPGPPSVQHSFKAAKAPSISHPAGSPTACEAAQVDAETSGGLTDDEIANAYGAFGLYRLGDYGAGQHIAVYELEPFLASDLETFDSCYFGASQAVAMAGKNGNLSGSRLSVIAVDGGEPQPGAGSENDEATLDIEDVSAIAPQAKIDVYEAPNSNSGGLDEYAQIVNDDTDQIVTSSWAACEQLLELAVPGQQQAENLLFEQAAAQGQTILSAAGDTGDDECNATRAIEPPAGQNLLSALDPGSQPYVLSVGGTTIDNATQPPFEHVWDDGAQWGAGGGGISQSWAMPSWQVQVADTTGNKLDVAHAEAFETATATSTAPFTTPTFCDSALNLPAGTLCRETPDVSAQADEFTGSVTIYGKSLGYGPADGWATIGGTSSATPIWAAVLALVNASPACSADRVNGVQDVGFASPILYGIAANATAYARSFNDIVSGNNDEYGLDNGLVFPARPGYDMASGLGSPQLTTPSGGNALAFYMCDYAGQLAPPAVTGLSPSIGSAAGGYSVTVSGTGFGSPSSPQVTSVQVGTTQAESFSVLNATTLSVVVPPAKAVTPSGAPRPDDGAGPVAIVVHLRSGASNVPDPADVFEYVDENSTPAPVPSVTSVGPSGGSESSPVPVRVYGSGFTGASQVSFGGVAAASFVVKSPYEIEVTPPAYSTQSCAALPTTGVYVGENATNDICQVQVVVTNANGSSATSSILPPYEGPITFDAMGSEQSPAGYELAPQPTEFDYLPVPTITSVSTGTLADLNQCLAPATTACNAPELASEAGGPANLITIDGTGMNGLSLDYALVGRPTDENSILTPVSETGTSIQLVVPALVRSSEQATIEPVSSGVRVMSMAGLSNQSKIVYAGVPKITSVVNSRTGLPGVPDSFTCASSPSNAGCGAPVTISGVGLLQAVGPIGFVDNTTGYSVGTQYHFAVVSDKKLTTESVAQNPAIVDIEVCTSTGCSYNPGPDELAVYPPGNPKLASISALSGPAQGGNVVVLGGANLGCIVAVAFGQVVTLITSNAQALLACGTTNEIAVLVPPGKAGTTVAVKVATVESYFDRAGQASNSLRYAYTPSAPSGPTEVTASPKAGSVTVRWQPPTSDGGSPITGYIVTASSPGFASVRELAGPTERNVSFDDLQAGTSWVFSVKASSKKGVGLRTVTEAVAPGLGSDGYLLVTQQGAVLGFGDVNSHGGIAGEGYVPAGIAATSSGLGYWIVTTSGRVTAFGNATFYGQPLKKDVAAIASLPDDKGYWTVTQSGAVQAFGQAVTYPGKVPKGSEIVAIASSPSGKGYLLTGIDGSVTAFGDARAHGSASASKLSEPIVGMATTPGGRGYWLVSADGRVFSFGDAPFHGSLAHKTIPAAIVGIAATPTGDGYWLVAANGTVYSFGAAKNLGGAPNAYAIGL
ncbi:MAG: protease pro-enzyme activation domain-containing protein [Acidimicrobiales bacterium]